MRNLLIIASIVTAAFACSSSAPHSSDKVTQVYVRQVGMIFFGSGFSAPVTLEVDVTNTSARDLLLRRISISSPGMTTYTIEPMSHPYDATIEPRRTHTVQLSGTARTRTSRLIVGEPLGVRVIAEFEGPEGRFREIHIMQAEMEARSAIR